MPVMKPGDKGPQGWPCPVCGGENTGNIQDGCQHCGAGTAQPYKKSKQPAPAPNPVLAEEEINWGMPEQQDCEPPKEVAQPFTSTPSVPFRVQEDTFSTLTSCVKVSWPMDLSLEEFEDIQAWLKVVVKKMRRRVKESQ